MITKYNADTDFDFLKNQGPMVGALPRRTVYGRAKSLVPLGDYPSMLVPESDYKATIEHCHDKKIFPLYHQRNSWAPEGFQWNHNGLGYCWAWSLAACLMDVRAREGKAVPLLAPTSLGFLVDWRNRGNYLEDGIRGATERGICTAEYVPGPHSTKYREFREGWQENALRYRLSPDDTWDLDNRTQRSMIQHAISVLSTGVPLYIAYYWWGHALECVGVRWDESEKNNLVWQIRNSHNEDDLIELTGTRGVPSEAFGIRATMTVE